MNEAVLTIQSEKTNGLVFLILGLWLAAVVAAGGAGLLAWSPRGLPLALVIAYAAPVTLFLIAYGVSASVRAFVLGLDLRLLTAMQGWRVMGGAFLILYAYGLIPGLFAWPAGLGDVAMGVTAPLVVLALIRNRNYAGSRGFVLWNVLGIFDFMVAFAAGTLSSGAFTHIIGGGVTTSLLMELPLGIIPAYAVPVFTLMHLSALFQARQAAKSAGA